MKHSPRAKPFGSTPRNSEDSEPQILNVHAVTDGAIENEVDSMAIERPPSVKQATDRLMRMRFAISQMGEQDRCTVMHINYVWATMDCGHSWCAEDLGDPAEINIGERMGRWPGAGTAGEEPDLSPWNNDQEW